MKTLATLTAVALLALAGSASAMCADRESVQKPADQTAGTPVVLPGPLGS